MSAAPGATDRADGATLLAFAGVVLFGGINAIAAKVSIRELAPFWSGGLRFLVAGLLLLALALLTRRALPRGRSLSGAVLYGAVAFAGSFGFIYPALREVPAGTAIVFLVSRFGSRWALADRLGEDLVGGLGPHEWGRSGVPVRGERVDPCDELLH